MATEKTRRKIIDALLALAAETPWHQIDLNAIADKAGITLAALRKGFSSKFEILEAFAAMIDAEVLEAIDKEMADEPARERLSDVLMNRFDALAPYKEGLRAIHKALAGDPLFAAAWNKIAVSSQHWMLAAAGISSAGLGGLMRAQGLVFAYARTFRIWLDDDDPGLAKTMAALDRNLARGERWLTRAEDMACRLAPLLKLARAPMPDCANRNRRDETANPAEEPAAS
ncbi:MAG: TetR/AcrR family transcriptional regulator [Hyphomicrobiales bacterium]|nr:TetR/AcrR family transcriptional regulator [Hyphomicrobiales bacterium]